MLCHGDEVERLEESVSSVVPLPVIRHKMNNHAQQGAVRNFCNYYCSYAKQIREG